MNGHRVFVNNLYAFNVVNALDTAKIRVGTVKVQNFLYAFRIKSGSICKSNILTELKGKDSICVIPSPFLGQFGNNFPVLVGNQSLIDQTAGDIILLVHGQCRKVVQFLCCDDCQHLRFVFISRLRLLAVSLRLLGGIALTAANHGQKHTHAQCSGEKFLVNLFHVILVLSGLIIDLLDNLARRSVPPA